MHAEHVEKPSCQAVITDIHLVVPGACPAKSHPSDTTDILVTNFRIRKYSFQFIIHHSSYYIF
jgi:hypothetical protein